MGAGNGIAPTSAFPNRVWERGEAQAKNATVIDRRYMNNDFKTRHPELVEGSASQKRT
jgi:hypothetical protein